MGPILVLYGQKSLYGAHIGPEWDECPDSAPMGPIYTYLLGSEICGQRRPRSACASALSDQDLHRPLTESLDTAECMNGEQMPG